MQTLDKVRSFLLDISILTENTFQATGKSTLIRLESAFKILKLSELKFWGSKMLGNNKGVKLEVALQV